MPRSLKVLIVEDSPLDAELIVHELKRADFDPQWIRVDNETTFLAQLNPSLEVVISDYQMPQFSGPRALELLLEREPQIPFILVSGALGEDKAVAAMKQGASDYLLKDRLGRLGPATAQAIAQSQLRRERREAEQALQASEARFHGLLDNMMEGCQILGPDWRYLYLNETAARHGRSRREFLLGRTVQECFPGFEQTEVFRVMERCMIRREGARIENEFTYEDGTKASFELSIQPVPEGVFILSLDVSERKESAAQLRESEERFRELAENINEVFWMTDPKKHEVLYISPAYETIWGRSCESLRSNSLNWVEAIHPDDRERVLRAAMERQVTGDYDEIYRIVRPDGSLRWIHDRAFPVRNDEGQVYRMVGTAEDVTEAKRGEFRTAVEHGVTAVLSVGGSLNETMRRIMEIVCVQLDWTIGGFWIVERGSRKLRCLELWHRPELQLGVFDSACRHIEFSLGQGFLGRVWSSKEPQWIPDAPPGEKVVDPRPIRETGLLSGVGFPIKVRDAVYAVMEFFSPQARPPEPAMIAMFGILGTQIGQFVERKQFENQVRQAQKMEAIGTLAGGIAHDFNNVLAAITGYAELAKMESRDRPEVKEYLQEVLAGTRRGADLVRQILAFSRQQESRRVPLQLRVILEEGLKLMRATIPSTIQFEISLTRQSPNIFADPTQIHQVIVNLVTNAAHAMRHQPGRLGVVLENIEVDANLAALHSGLRPGRYVRLIISDTGHGMDEATLARIFDPFFTTKPSGEGTGLGLAVVHGIVQSLDGVITVYSRPNEGARFNLYFPAHDESVAPSAPAVPEPKRGEGQRILVIDDEAPLALMARKILDRLGYCTDALSVPADAVALVKAEPTKYHAVVTDLTMPGMTGLEVAAKLRQIRPDLPILLTTGYSATMTTARVRELGIREMLLKPLNVEQLAEAVHRVLHPPPA